MDETGLFDQRGPSVQAPTPPGLYADVVVRARTRAVGTFSYAIPPALRERIAPGQLVRVPFRVGQLPGIVISLTEKAPTFAVKEIAEIIDPQPVVIAAQIALAHWMAETYLCSLAEALFAMLPPGLLARSHTLAALTAAGRTRPLEGLAALSRRVVEALRVAEEPVNVLALYRLLERNASETLARLSRKGWLVLSNLVEEPAARPHREPYLVLTGTPEEVAALRAELRAGRRNSAAARVLEALARAPAGRRDRLSLAREVKAHLDVFAALEEEGLLRIEPAQRLLRLAGDES